MFHKLPDPGATTVTIYLDGEPIPAEPGESVAGVLFRQDDSVCRTTPVHDNPRTPYCMMGVCFDCLAVIDGQASVQSCQVTVQEGMRVERQHGRRKVNA